MITNGNLEVGAATAGAAGVLIFVTSVVSLLVVRDARAKKGLGSSGSGLLRPLEVLAWSSLMLATVVISAALLELPPLFHHLKNRLSTDAASKGKGTDGGT